MVLPKLSHILRLSLKKVAFTMFFSRQGSERSLETYAPDP